MATVILACAGAMGQSIKCLVIGDSIAQGAAQYAGGCYSAAQVGISSKQWLKQWPTLPTAETVLIALGTNDKSGTESMASLHEIRMRLGQSASRVIWIAPGERFPARNAVIAIAQRYGDIVYESPGENLAKDEIHFTAIGYRRIADALVVKAR